MTHPVRASPACADRASPRPMSRAKT
jgi:hypothetical protein